MDFSNIEVLHLPDISKLTFKKIHKDYLKVLIFTTISVFLILFLILFLLETYVSEIASHQYLNFFYMLIGCLFVLVFTPLVVGFSRRKYVLRDKDVTYKSGVFIKKMTTVPFSRIQHVEINEAPISRVFKLAALNVFTAGDSSNDLVIKGIKKDEALRIKEFINQQING